MLCISYMPRSRHPLVWLPLLAVLGWLSFPPQAHVQEAVPDAGDAARAARFGGIWQLATSRTEAEGVVDAAATVTANAMNIIVRPIARNRLVQGTPIHGEIELRFGPDGRLTTRLEGGDSHTTRIGRPARRVAGNGDPVTLTQRFRENGQLEQAFEAPTGTRWYVWTPTEGEHMRIEITTDSPRLPQAMHFVLHYRRQ